MKLSKHEKIEMKEDGKNKNRRRHLRALRAPSLKSFEDYAAALDDLLSVGEPRPPRPSAPYTNIRL